MAKSHKNLRFDYDAMGNRIAKHIYTDNQFTDWERSTYYVRDASGNVMAVYDREATGQEPPSTFRVSERHIDGSSRLGMDVTTYDFISTAYTITNETTRELGHKQYEISNHLGNVLSVITDQKLPVVDATLVVSYSAVVVTATDYSPFGVGLYGRSWSGEYRYGFNGQEVTSEINRDGNSINFNHRIHDPRIGRFSSIDPISSEYPCFTPYSFSGNRLIDAFVYEGLEPLRDADGKINGDFKPVFRINLPDGTFATIYRVHGGKYAITPEDRNRINNFQNQGFKATARNRFDPHFTPDNTGQTVQAIEGVGGVSQYTGPDNFKFENDLFRNTFITGPSQIIPQAQVQQAFAGVILSRSGAPLAANTASDAGLTSAGVTTAGFINAAINALQAAAPPGSVVNNFNVTVSLNQNLSADQQTMIRNAITANVAASTTINFNTFDPATDPYAQAQALPDSTTIAAGQITATQTGPALPTLQPIE